MTSEQRILIETDHFYAYQLSAARIEIRLKDNGHSLALGIVPSLARAQRFIERCERYPHNLQYLVPATAFTV